ncbi:rCG31322 [Rattus norvegicus]|uniref:RCG31322 n=1 Tax=Rattus norvegicus TaxID=10116 RepID=A6ISI7_RAT|nr:rCG31322 [Rattus norvegicus]
MPLSYVIPWSCESGGEAGRGETFLPLLPSSFSSAGLGSAVAFSVSTGNLDFTRLPHCYKLHNIRFTALPCQYACGDAHDDV